MNVMSKFGFFWCVTLLGMTLAAGERDVTVGAIRWDAWGGRDIPLNKQPQTGTTPPLAIDATRQVERTLAPAKYDCRKPWFFRKVDGVWQSHGGTTDVMEQEIAWAVNAGIDYWAFLEYPEENSRSVALKQFLASPNNGKMRFCLILHYWKHFKTPETWAAEVERIVRLVKHPRYFRLPDGRPLLLNFGIENDPNFQPRLAELCARLKKEGLEPYSVFMGWWPSRDYQRHGGKAKNIDAVSHYACGASYPTFAELVTLCENNYWNDAKKHKLPYIPLVTTGWNKEPRKDNPVSWELNDSYHKKTLFTPVAKPEEIAAHLGRSLDFVRQNPDICPARTVLIYAWNEYDEGGWIAPTLGSDGKPDTSRLDAVGRVLNR